MCRTQHDQLAATVNQLEADNVALTDANRLMAEAASERDTLMHELEEEARSLHTRWGIEPANYIEHVFLQATKFALLNVNILPQFTFVRLDQSNISFAMYQVGVEIFCWLILD